MFVEAENGILFLGVVALVSVPIAIWRVRRYRNGSAPRGSADLGDHQDPTLASGDSPEEELLSACVSDLDLELAELSKLLARLEEDHEARAPANNPDLLLDGDDTVLVDLEGVTSVAEEVAQSNAERRAALQRALESEAQCPDWEQASPELVSLIEDFADTYAPSAELPIEPDDLKQIRGIGKVLEGVLNEKGIQTFEQLASLSIDDIEELSKGLKHFGNRVIRDRWVEQAQALALGNQSAL